ncbi:hypothetical protein [Arthrobacter sp. MYb227]|uniref:hypothetical protein n=1 Tax=Arthrobacter sp. MYb227 TaxID=1848601 RepID=UPI0011B0794B|nr:hypothetical protein [Arthrobacter sp. MYb227]
MNPHELAPNIFWRCLPLLAALLMLLLLVVIDPLLAGAPLWNIYEEGLWLPLAFPWIPWVLCTFPAIIAGNIGASRAMIACLSLLSLASGIIPAVIWALLIHDVAPSSGSSWVAAAVALFSGLVLVLLLIWLALRSAWRARRNARVPRQAARL